MNDTYKELQAFIFTVDEYKRLFPEKSSTHDLLAPVPREDEYREIKLKLIVLRKYTSKDDKAYIGRILSKVSESHLTNKTNELIDSLQEIEQNPLTTLFNDGEKLNLRETIELELYGVYLHADYDKISKLLTTDEKLRFIAIRKYVELQEQLLYKTYDLIIQNGIEPFNKQLNKGEALLVENQNGVGQNIKNSSYWSNLYGRDVDDKEGIKALQELNDEEFLIFVVAAVFLEELEQVPIPVERLKQLVHPATYRDWGSFVEAQKQIKELTNIGLSSRIRFNSRHDIAYVYILENVTDSFLIEASQIISDAKVINLVAIHEKEWRIYSIGDRLEDYLVKVSPLEGLHKIASKLVERLDNKTDRVD